jgi:hypothetical protein
MADVDLERNSLLHSIIIQDSGLYCDYHRRQSSLVIEGRTVKRIQKRINEMQIAFADEIKDGDSEMLYKIDRLKRQLRYRKRLDEFRRVLYTCGGAISKSWKTSLSGGAGNNHLHEASRFGHLEMCIDLLNKKWHINAKNNYGQTPLILACREGHVRVVRLFLKGQVGWRGGRSKLLIRDMYGHGELGYAKKGAMRIGMKKQKGCRQIVEMLENVWNQRKRRRRRKKKYENGDIDKNIDSSEGEESDSDPESSCYECVDEEEEEEVVGGSNMK